MSAGAKEGKKKGGSKKAAGGKASKDAAKAEALAALAAAATEQRLQSALASSHSALHRLYRHAISHSINCCQLLYLLRVFPDMESRLALMALLQPTLWDPARLADVIMDLDHPVSEPPAIKRDGCRLAVLLS